MDGPKVGIVIPALNEASSIAAVLMLAERFGRTIVVDDGSNDDTGSIAAGSGALVVRHEQNLGYDASLNSGFLKANELGIEYIITMDADGQHDPSMIGKCIELLVAGADVVVGIRDRKQRLTEFFFDYLAWAMYGLRDPLCGFKGYRISVYQKLGHFDSYSSIGTELVFFAAQNGYKLTQFPISTRERYDKARFGQGWLANKKIIKSMIFLLFRAYIIKNRV